MKNNEEYSLNEQIDAYENSEEESDRKLVRSKPLEKCEQIKIEDEELSHINVQVIEAELESDSENEHELDEEN